MSATIFVVKTDGKKVQFSHADTKTIGELRAEITQRLGIPDPALIHMGTNLDHDPDTFLDQSITPGADVYITQEAKGGKF